MNISESLANFEGKLLEKKVQKKDSFNKNNPLYESLVSKLSSADTRNCKTALEITNKYENILKECLQNFYPDRHWTDITNCNIRTELMENNNDIEATSRKIVESLKVRTKTGTSSKKPTGVLAKNMSKN